MVTTAIFRKGFMTTLILLVSALSYGQGVVVSQKEIKLSQTSYWPRISEQNKLKPAYQYLDSLRFYEIMYLSDGLKIKGYIIKPANGSKLPVVIFNRGGNEHFAAIDQATIMEWLVPIARNGYMVIASQYRGGPGSEGKDSFCGDDVNDVLNLFPIIDKMPDADTGRIAMYGWSRGGIMTYLALTRTNRIKTAIVGGSPTELAEELKRRPGMETVCRSLIPGYSKHRDSLLRKRSAIYWCEQFSPNTSLLLLHGKQDWRVHYSQSQNLAVRLQQLGRACRLELFDSGDHILDDHKARKEELILEWLRQHL